MAPGLAGGTGNDRRPTIPKACGLEAATRRTLTSDAFSEASGDARPAKSRDRAAYQRYSRPALTSWIVLSAFNSVA